MNTLPATIGTNAHVGQTAEADPFPSPSNAIGVAPGRGLYQQRKAKGDRIQQLQQRIEAWEALLEPWSWDELITYPTII